MLMTKVRRSAVLVVRTRTQKWSKAFPQLAFLVGILTAPAIVLAAGTWQWTAQLTGNGFPVLGPFSTNEQAVQALGAAAVQRCASVGIPCPAESSTLQKDGDVAMTPNSKTYHYSAITPSTPTSASWSCYVWSDDPTGANFSLTLGPSGCYASEASAVAAVTSMPGCYTQPNGVGGITAFTNVWVTPAGGWSSQLLAESGISTQAEIVEANSRVYNGYQQNPLLNNNCATTFTYNQLLWRNRGANCPENFSPSLNGGYPQPVPGNDTLCYGPIGGTVTGNLLECAATAGPSTLVGDPCDVATGDFTQTESDYSGAGLHFTRAYHSLSLESGMGVGWTHNYASHLVLTSGVPTGLVRPDGHDDAISVIGGSYESLSGAAIHVQHSGANWIAYLTDGSSEVYSSTGQLSQLVTSGGIVTTLSYNSNNQLVAVTDPFGHSLQFGYNANNQIQQMVDPAGNIISYTYDGNNNLTSATYQDGSIRTYLYENSSFPNNLTGVLDESNTRFLTVTYDPTTGAVTSSQQAGGAQAVSIIYGTNTAVATDSLGALNTYTFTTDSSFAPRATIFSRNALTQTFAVPLGATDPQRRVTQGTDANGNVTTFTYDNNHLTSKTEAYGTPLARMTSYQYLSITSALPTLITEPLKTTALAYYSGTNNIETKTVTDTTVTPNVARTWTYTYDTYGRVLIAKGPRTDVNSTTTYAYYTCTTGSQCGQIQTITNAAGQITSFNTYNAYGQPLTITDPNGVVTTLSYDGRQRLLSREVGTETTGYNYYPTGLLNVVTLPDSSILTYTYDGAHRLTDITDGLGNHIHYTLDAMGNHTAENSYDPSNALHRTHTRVINALNQLYQDVNAAGTAAVTTTYTYDNNGNQASADAPLSRNTSDQYDALNRLTQITDPNSGITKLGYDANDNLVSVNDPRSLTTSYTRNGFGDVTQTVSPDTGTTTNTYDSGGNLKTATDARGALATYSYDAMNRVTQVAYADQTINFTYDSGTNGIGRLTGASDANHSMSWAYDTHGRVTGKGQTIGTVTKSVGYAYTNGDLVSLVTPSGQTIRYSYNSNHQVTGITVNGTVLLSNVTYEPFGQVNGWTWGNGTAVTRTYDTDGKIVSISSAGTKTYGFDNAFRITSISDTESGATDWTYGYDLLDRLTSAAGGSTTIGLTYDANGNRLTQSGTFTSTYNISSTSNQIVSITGTNGRNYSYDAAGNTLGYNGRTSFTYNNRGRMVANGNTTTGVSSPYVYNALGQLIETNLNTVGIRLFWYDEAGHYLGVYNGSGGLGDETVWLGDIPVATVVASGHSFGFYYIHTDHLNTPRQATLPSNNTQMWTWFSDPFGTTAENQNPQGNGTFNYPPRFPGQVSTTQVAGLYQNGFRDYDPQTGRYIESDPIGLSGGSASTYAYVGGNPVSSSDPSGLCDIKLRCGRVRRFGITLGWHCGVIAPNGAEYGLGGGDKSSGSSGTAQPYVGQPEPPATDQVEYSVKCGCQSCADVQTCIQNYHDTVAPPPYKATGPNSNTYAHNVTNKCGCSASQTPAGAPAWNYGF